MGNREDRIMVNGLTATEVIDRLADTAYKYCGSGKMTEHGKNIEGIQMLNDFAWCFGSHLAVKIERGEDSEYIQSKTIDGVSTGLKIPTQESKEHE